jgi:hypothetical protein
MLSLSNSRHAYGNFHSCQNKPSFCLLFFSMPIQVFQHLCVFGLFYRSKLRFQSEKHLHTSSAHVHEGPNTLLFLILSGSPIPPSLSIYGSTALAGPWPLFQLLNPYTVGRIPWTGDQPAARPLPEHRTAQTQNKRTQTFMPRVGLEPTIPVF